MKKKFLFILAITLFLGGAFLVFTSLHKTVTLVVNGDSQSTITYTFTVGRFLEAQGILLKDEDVLNLPLGHWLREGEIIQLEQAGQFFIVADGEEHVLLTAARKPANILAQADVPLYAGDQVYVDGELSRPDAVVPYRAGHSLQVRRATPISLYMDGQERTFTSNAVTLAQALWGEGIRFRNGDHLSPGPHTLLGGDPLRVQLSHAQELTIHLPPHKTVHTLSTAPSVGTALAEAGLSLQGLDYSVPDENSPLPEDGEIQVVRVREDIILEQEPIPFGSSFQSTNELELDTQQILEAGEYGIQAKRVRVRYENGEEVAREVEKEWVAKEPVSRVVGYGTKVNVRTVETADGALQYWRAVTAYATSYKPGDAGVGNITASGATLEKGVIGVIRSWFNYMQGQRVYIPGYGFATIEDIGGGYGSGHWVDLGYSEGDYVNWHQNVTVYFLTPVPAPENIMWVLE